MKLVSMLFLCLCSIGTITFSSQPTKEGKVTFYIKKGFSTIEGEFREMDYKITLEPSGTGTIEGTVDISSVSTGNTTRDKHLQNQTWFDAANYPKVRLRSRKVVKKNKEEYTGTFEVTIKGKTEVQEIPFHIIEDGALRILKTTFHLSKATFDIGGGMVDLLVGDKVTVEVQLPFK